MASKLIVLEFNELCPSLMDQFIAEGRLPNFERLKRESHVYTTEAGEQPPYLEPWIQWVTIHTGLPYSEHGVFDLGDGAKLQVPRVWDLVGQKGGKVWICGSMNASFHKPIDGFILPDPWSTGIQPYPAGEFEDFYDFVRRNVQEHTRDSVPMEKSVQLKFLAFMASHGLSVETVSSIVKQLMSERGGASRWKRAVILDSLQWDVFHRYWHKHQPEFSTFFLNSTAHFQHMYWRNMEPALFKAKPSEEQQAEYSSAIRFGYEHMDEIAGKCLRMADRETTIVLATALSQQPCLKYEENDGKVFYRMVDQEKFFAYLGIGACEYAPVMSEQFKLLFRDEQSAEDARQKLASLKLDGKEVMLARRTGSEVFAGCQMFTRIPREAVVESPRGSFRFHEQFYDCALVKSGMHHPDGILWIRTPSHKGDGDRERRVPLERVAPTLLALLGHAQPEFMKAEPLDSALEASGVVQLH